MKEIKRNIAANFAGSVWANLLNIAAVPIYLSFLGIEAYGLVGFYLALQMMLAYLDFGLGPATVRETARLAAVEGSAQRQRDLVRTLEYIYWALALLFGVLVYVAAPLIAAKWIQPERLSTVAVTGAVQWMGIAIAVQFPKSMYVGALMGLQKQVLLNVISGSSNTLRVLASMMKIERSSYALTSRKLRPPSDR